MVGRTNKRGNADVCRSRIEVFYGNIVVSSAIIGIKNKNVVLAYAFIVSII